ncbi:MAG: GTPase ObgE [Lentisphaerae bacterium]|nr:GTPase ObgE [Lentisphaerota bacterium]
MKSRRFIDRVTVHVRSGKGGDGSSSFLREKYVDNGGPDGGDGGRGGHIFFVGDHDTDSLVRLYFEPLVVAEDGGAGRKKQMHGKDGADRDVKVPCGTSIFDARTGELLADIIRHGQRECLARGGKGGLGNIHFKTSTHQAPTEHTPGEDPDERDLQLELKTVADVGLLGFPSAGKSSLLASISDAHPKIAAYPFTTLHPIIGTVAYPDYSQIRVADIPGIIKDASEGVGLGLDFLRHVSRSRILLMVIDMAGTDGREPWQDYRTLRAELKAYDAALLDRPTLLVANKMDVPEAKANLAVFRKKVRGRILQISTVDGRGLDTLKTQLWELIRPVAGRREIAEPEAVAMPATAVSPVPAEPIRVSRILDESGTEESVEIVTEDRVRHAGFLVIEPKKKKRRQ